MRRFTFALLMLVLCSSTPAFAVIPQLETTVIGANADTVWVVVTTPPNVCGVSSGSCQPIWSATYSIVPCPLNRTCATGTYSPHFTTPVPDTLALNPQLTYTLGGMYTCAYQVWHPIYDCQIEMSFDWYYQPVTFSYATTPTARRTWGALKSIYR